MRLEWNLKFGVSWLKFGVSFRQVPIGSFWGWVPLQNSMKNPRNFQERSKTKNGANNYIHRFFETNSGWENEDSFFVAFSHWMSEKKKVVLFKKTYPNCKASTPENIKINDDNNIYLLGEYKNKTDRYPIINPYKML